MEIPHRFTQKWDFILNIKKYTNMINKCILQYQKQLTIWHTPCAQNTKKYHNNINGFITQKIIINNKLIDNIALYKQKKSK